MATLTYAQSSSTDTLARGTDCSVRSQAAQFLHFARRLGDRVTQSYRYRCGIRLWVLREAETGQLYSLKLVPAVVS